MQLLERRRLMSNRCSDANDAVWAMVQATFTSPTCTPVRNPKGDQAGPKPRSPTQIVPYVEQMDDMTSETIRAFAGQLFDLKLTPQITFAFVGAAEADRRAMCWAAVEQLKTAISFDTSLGMVVEYAEVDAPTDAEADRLPWMAGGLRVPVVVYFNAPTQAG